MTPKASLMHTHTHTHTHKHSFINFTKTVTVWRMQVQFYQVPRKEIL